VRDGEHLTLRAEVDGESVDAWTTTLDRQYPIDFEMANHYTATHPASPFVNRLTLRAYSGDTRVTVMNRDVTFATRDGAVTTELADRRALRTLVAERFGFDLPEIETMRVPAVPEWADGG
jgi:N-hydroxyarylamine O-acetyltransferase